MVAGAKSKKGDSPARAPASAPHAAELEGDLVGEIVNDPAVKDLQALDEEYLTLEKELHEERCKLEQRYEQRYKDLLDQRSQRLARPAADNGAGAKATPSIPGFWKTVLQNSAEFQEDVEEYDEPVLDYLREIQYEWLDETRKTGFRLRFYFDPNQFFSNEVLEKVYHTERKNAFIDRLDCTKIVAPKIDWKAGGNVTVELVTKKPKGGGRKKQGKAKVREEVSRPSFFRTFFRNLGPDEEIPEEELEDQEEDEEECLDLMECLISDDYEQALALREYIVPHAVRWYTGEACEDDDDDEDDEDDEDLDEEEDEEEDDDEEGDSDEEGEGESAERKASKDTAKRTDKGKKKIGEDCKEQ